MFRPGCPHSLLDHRLFCQPVVQFCVCSVRTTAAGKKALAVPLQNPRSSHMSRSVSARFSMRKRSISRLVLASVSKPSVFSNQATEIIWMEKRIGKTDIFSSAPEQKRTPRIGIFARLGSSFLPYTGITNNLPAIFQSANRIIWRLTSTVALTPKGRMQRGWACPMLTFHTMGRSGESITSVRICRYSRA